MKINENGNIFMGDDSRSQRMENSTGNQTQKSGNVFAGDLNIQKDPITEKREEARKKAMRVFTDAYTNERKVDDDLDSRLDKIKTWESKMKSAQDKLDEIEEAKTKLKETYQIDEDSQEQKDLKLLEKRRDSDSGSLFFTDEEKERLTQIDKNGLTEYQQRSLELDKPRKDYEENLEEAKKGIILESATIRGIKLERLKTHPMLDATKQMDEIMKAANEEVYGMLMDEIKESIDEKAEAAKEKAEEKAEEKEKKEEQIEELKERIEELEKLANPEKAEESEKNASDKQERIDSQTRNILEMDSIKKDVKKEVENIVDKMKLIAEDVKGIKVDELL